MSDRAPGCDCIEAGELACFLKRYDLTTSDEEAYGMREGTGDGCLCPCHDESAEPTFPTLAGAHPDAQSRRDSLTDAAQLLCENFEPDETGHSIHYAGDCAALGLQYGLSTDEEIERTIHTLKPTKRGIAAKRSHMTKACAAAGGRAAFRACPGLR